MRHLKIVVAVLSLALAGGMRAQASPLLVSDVPGNGLLRVANQADQGLSEAYIRISTTGRFHLHTEGAAPQDFRGNWNNTGPGIYDLQVNSGFGTWGATGSGRLIVNGPNLQQFEVAGVTSGAPFYMSFGAGGYSCPGPEPDGFSLGLGLGLVFGGGYGPPGYFYPAPFYSGYGHYNDGRVFRGGRGFQVGGGAPRAYSNFAGRNGQSGGRPGTSRAYGGHAQSSPRGSVNRTAPAYRQPSGGGSNPFSGRGGGATAGARSSGAQTRAAAPSFGGGRAAAPPARQAVPAGGGRGGQAQGARGGAQGDRHDR